MLFRSLTKAGINIIVIDTEILNTSNKSDLEKTLISNIVFELLSYMAEKERLKTRQRQREGIAQAQAKGKHLGRPVMDWNSIEQSKKDKIKELYPKWKSKEITATKFMEIVELKRNTFYKIIKEYEEERGYEMIKGIEKLTDEQREHMQKVNKSHVAAVGNDYKEGMQIIEAWIDENNIVCVRLKNEKWYHYTKNGTWY